MNPFLENRWLPIFLLFFSNIFMTFAWYGHLKHKEAALWKVILASWGIALMEYILMVPANRWGNSVYTATQLKIIQEVVTLTVFCGFATLYLGEKIRWNHIAAFFCVLAAVAFTFLPKAN
ncbi:MAG TPA: DMT family protein [Verrucomicrobiae bacterium]|nr:DMT family protein [Verrucomicrobiae bacterium]